MAAAGLAGGIVLSCPGSFAQLPANAELQGIQRIAPLSTDNSNPAIAFSRDGASLFVAWDGIINGNRRIFVRERVGEQWLDPVIVDNNPAGKNDCPTVAVDAAGTPYVSWISSVKGKRSPALATRVSRYPNSWRQQEVPFPRESAVEGGCDFVTLKLDGDQRPWLVWQFGFGNVTSIACSRFNADGELVTQELTPGAVSHNIDPKLFFTPVPTIYWYVAQADQFYLVGSRYEKDRGEWQIAPPENLDNLPADNLPELFQSEGGPFSAIWYAQGSSSETDENHVYIGIQDPETQGGGEAIEGAGDTDYHSVAGIRLGAQYVTGWIAESYSDGAQVYAGLGDSPAKIKTFKLSADSSISNSLPQLAATRNEVTAAWVEQTLVGTTRIAVRSLHLK